MFFELREFPFFIQERGLTLSKYRFGLYKIKTLRNSDIRKTLPPLKGMILSKSELSPYVGGYAGFLRRTGFDELPQLINIIKGEMSLIGPRPLMMEDLKRLKNEFPDLYLQREALNSIPGLSGLWQIFCDRHKDVENLILLDTLYEKLRSFSFDSKLLLWTIPLIIIGNNSDSILSSKYKSYKKQFVSSGLKFSPENLIK